MLEPDVGILKYIAVTTVLSDNMRLVIVEEGANGNSGCVAA